MSRFFHVWQRVEGSITQDDVDINYVVMWVKDLVSGSVDIDTIDEVWVTDENGNEVSDYYSDHKEEVRTAIYSDAYAKGEPVFEDEVGVSYEQMLESFAEQEKEE